MVFGPLDATATGEEAGDVGLDLLGGLVGVVGIGEDEGGVGGVEGAEVGGG